MDGELFADFGEKFSDPKITAKGEPRAVVPLVALKTLWFNTGTLCNIECANCYILSSPTNDALVYLTTEEVVSYLEEINERRAEAPKRWPVPEIGFTGGEPFMNPDMIGILRETLSRGFEALVLTNAMAPMMRPRVKEGLLALHEEFPDTLTMRISIDHYSKELHDRERGKGSFEKTLIGMRWLSEHGFRMDVAGRTCWNEDDAGSRKGYQALFDAEGFDIPASDASRCVLFPEMDEVTDVPEITTACWKILGKSPADIMCASSRMVVKHRGAQTPSVIACTLLPYEREFDLGQTLKDSQSPVSLNHKHCAKFCVLGGGSCSA